MTEAQAKVFDALERHMATHEWAPSLSELAAAVGLRSKNTVCIHLRSLERDGHIFRGKNPRQIRIIG